MEEYPDILLPKSTYKPDMGLETLDGKHDFILSRRIDLPYDEAIRKDGEYDCLTSDALDSIDERCSMNMLGAGFEKEHTKYEQKRPASDAWDGKDVTDISQYEEYISLKESTAVFYKAYNMYRQFPCNRTFDKEKEAMQKESQLKAIGAFVERVGKFVTTQAQSFLKHSPTMSNYWHVEFQLKPSADDPAFKNIKAAWKETLFHVYQRACFGFIEKDSVEIIPIEESWYNDPQPVHSELP